MSPRARLLKVIVQPVVVLDDGDNLTEYTLPVVAIAGAGWGAFAAEAFSADELAKIADALLADNQHTDG